MKYCPNCNKSNYFECDGKTNGYCRACNKKSRLVDFYEDEEKERDDAYWQHNDDWIKERKSKLMGISERTLATLRSEGKIPFIKIHRRTLYRTADLYRYLKDNSTLKEN